MNNCGLPVDLFRFASLALALDRASPFGTQNACRRFAGLKIA